MNATREVGEAVSGIQMGTQKNIDNVEYAVKAIDDATQLARGSGIALSEIVSMVENAALQVQAIAAASQQQAIASDEINNATEQVAAISAETSKAMGQATGAIVELARQTQRLKSLADDLGNAT